jgi:photosystem II stability/assembly factor-like uncharacterized protein
MTSRRSFLFGLGEASVGILGAAPGITLAAGVDGDVHITQGFLRTPMLSAVSSGSTWVAAGTHGVVVRSIDQGKTWKQLKAVPTRVTLTSASFLDEKQGCIVGHRGTIISTRDGGESWEKHVLGPEIVLLGALIDSVDRLFAVGQFGSIFESRDSGKTWGASRVPADGDFQPHLFRIVRVDTSTLLVSAEGGRIYRSTDNGQSWTLQRLPTKASFWGLVRVSTQQVIAYGMAGNAYFSNDMGRTWEPLSLGTRSSVVDAIVISDGRAWLLGADGLVVNVHQGVVKGVRYTAGLPTITGAWVRPGSDKGVVFATTGGIREPGLFGASNGVVIGRDPLVSL